MPWRDPLTKQLHIHFIQSLFPVLKQSSQSSLASIALPESTQILVSMSSKYWLICSEIPFLYNLDIEVRMLTGLKVDLFMGSFFIEKNWTHSVPSNLHPNFMNSQGNY